MIKNKSYILFLFVFILLNNALNAQTGSVAKKAVAAWDGMAIVGYVNDGAYITLGGPCLRLIKKPLMFSVGFLPSVRIKEDKVATGAKKNSTITPSLGFGATFCYKHFALQVPVYYNPKTALVNGKWNLGVGVGYKF